MRKFFLLAFLLFLSSKTFADWTEYDARPGLIPVGGIVVFFNSVGPLSYKTMTPKEIPADAKDMGIVRCKSCQHGLSVPIDFSSVRSTNISGAQGDGSFKKALARLQEEKPELSGIYDVKVDMQRTSILGIYRRLCTEVTARGFK